MVCGNVRGEIVVEHILKTCLVPITRQGLLTNPTIQYVVGWSIHLYWNWRTGYRDTFASTNCACREVFNKHICHSTAALEGSMLNQQVERDPWIGITDGRVTYEYVIHNIGNYHSLPPCRASETHTKKPSYRYIYIPLQTGQKVWGLLHSSELWVHQCRYLHRWQPIR